MVREKKTSGTTGFIMETSIRDRNSTDVIRPAVPGVASNLKKEIWTVHDRSAATVIGSLLGRDKPAILVRLFVQPMTNAIVAQPLAALTAKHHLRLGL